MRVTTQRSEAHKSTIITITTEGGSEAQIFVYDEPVDDAAPIYVDGHAVAALIEDDAGELEFQLPLAD